MKTTARIDITSSLFREDDPPRRLDAIVEACRRHGFQVGIQVHNTAEEAEIESCRTSGLPLTVHAPLLSNWQLNLASKLLPQTLHGINRSVEVMRRLNASQAVFHGFVMTDEPVLSFGRGRSYDEAMTSVLRKELALPESRLCNDFTAMAEYQERIVMLKENLRWLRAEYPETEFLIENDFPSYGAGNIFAETAAKLNHGICLDSGHLWTASFIFDRDFITEAGKFIASGKVRMVHLHGSDYTPAIPKKDWGDGHKPLGIGQELMRLPELVRMCRDGGIRHFVFEIRGVSAADVELFARMWGA